MKKLSILIPSTHKRWNNFNLKIQEQIFSQYENLSEKEQEEVEILMLVDTKSIMLGAKRSMMVDIAQGEYVVHVDSDDVLAEDYIKTLLEATKFGKDVITFTAMVSLNGEKAKPCYYSKDFKKDSNEDSLYKRIPNHITCIKRNIANKVDFPNVLYGEDSGFSKAVLPLLKSEHKIDKVLYYYNYNSETSETQKLIERQAPTLRKNKKFLVDVIILSNAKDDKFRRMTQRSIDTCISGAKSYPLNILVLEQNSNIYYNNAGVIHIKEDFNYNKFANVGIMKGESEWIMVANNDLIFTRGWLDKLISANNPVVSPRCRRDYRQKHVKDNLSGYELGTNLSGWCFMMKRYVWEEIGGLDEDFNFWFADQSFLEQLKAIDIKAMLVADSLVTHLGSTTLKTQNNMDDLTWGQVKKFNDKYNREEFVDNINYQNWLKMKGGI